MAVKLTCIGGRRSRKNVEAAFARAGLMERLCLPEPGEARDVSIDNEPTIR
jgi:hypothetical protein